MERLAAKYAAKLEAAGLVEPGGALVGGLDAELVWSAADPLNHTLARVFDLISINSLVCARPAEPYATAIRFLAARETAVRPRDCETRTFLHDLPVAGDLEPETIAAALRRRKSVIAPGGVVLAFGTVSPEQAFVTVSSVCFACLVKFFADSLAAARAGRLDDDHRAVLARAAAFLPPVRRDQPDLAAGPPADEAAVIRAMDQAGKATVTYGLVDSYFGNISYLLGDTLYISQTGSSLDELVGCIDPCPLDGSSTAALTASSELTAHREVVRAAGCRAVLHGHPKFSVIISLDCTEEDCPQRGADACHLTCPRPRAVGGVPIVPGEVGTGLHGLCHTLPPALAGRPGAIVYGHGLFTTGRDDFREAFASLLAIENLCRGEYFARLATLGVDLPAV